MITSLVWTSCDLYPCLTSKPRCLIILCDSVLPHRVLHITFRSLVLSQAQVLKPCLPFYIQRSGGLSERVLSYSKNQLFFLPENMVPLGMRLLSESGMLIFYFSKIRQLSLKKNIICTPLSCGT